MEKDRSRPRREQEHDDNQRRDDGWRRSNRIEFHPATEIYPHVDDNSPEVLAMADDIRACRRRGETIVIDPITLDRRTGKILDGRKRYCACLASGVEPRFEEYEGSDPEVTAVRLHHERGQDDERRRAVHLGAEACGRSTRPHARSRRKLLRRDHPPLQDRGGEARKRRKAAA